MTSYLLSQNLEKCYGCRSCEQICPKQAIEIKSNPEGFLYPLLIEDKCIKCGLCAKACPYDSPSEAVLPMAAFAAQYNDKDALRRSSSGGAFSALADYVLEKNGYVAGCVFDDNFATIHILTNRKESVEKMRGSKYVQSDLQDVYARIKMILDQGILVLFTGTPCQVDGLKCFLRKEYGNLLTVDLICHGVPSQRLLNYYLRSLSDKKGSIQDIKFRDKARNGWCSQGSVTYSGKTKTISPFNSSYYNFYYLQNNVSRMSCYFCKYSARSRVGDITIGDFWNISDTFPTLDVSNGYSAVLINTEKGKSVFQKISSKLSVYETDLETVVKGNGNLSNPSPLPESRRNLYSRINEEGYDSVAKKECKFQYIKPLIRRLVPKGLKRFLKKFLR